MQNNIQFIKDLCDERLIRNEFIKDKNAVRIFPNSFDNSTLSHADLLEYVFKLENPRLDTQHTGTSDGKMKVISLHTDIIEKK